MCITFSQQILSDKLIMVGKKIISMSGSYENQYVIAYQLIFVVKVL